MKESNETPIVEEEHPLSNIQIVITREDKFLLLKRFKDRVACIVPYYKYEESEYGCEFSIPNRNSRLKRIENAYQMVESIGSYTVSANNVGFDCLENFPEGIFKEENLEGWIHFNHNTLTEVDEKKNTRTTVVQIDDRIVFEKITDEDPRYEFEFPQRIRIKYKPLGIKVFPVIFDEGFILVIVNKKTMTATMYVSITDVNKMFVGNAAQGEVNNLIRNVLPFFPFFNCGVNEEMANVYLKNLSGLKPFLTELGLNRCLLKFMYTFSKTDICLCKVIGK